MITAPYNFVPLNKEVFYPSWSNDGNEVSHDVPFEDGESGEIEITITAKSPIFIRGHSKDNENPSSEFCHFVNNNGAKEFYIPGSSIKGMIRSILEIMSFSKIKVDEAKLKQPLSVRDMTNNLLVGKATGCGFLIKNGNNYNIEDCGKILTISQYDLPKDYQGIKKLESAKAKYEKFGIKKVNFTTYKKMMDVRGKQIPKIMAKIDDSSSSVGTLVFTGDIGNKKHEFIFKSNGQSKQLDIKIFQNFEKVYLKNEESIDGQYWKEKFKIQNTKIPVFYVEVNGEIQAIGLTQLFKLQYTKTLYDAICQNKNDKKLDLAETIFGIEKDALALKGRVQFGHFKSTMQRFEKEVEQVLGSPNPTYYPNYIRQTELNDKKVAKYKTLMDSDAQISGWKRYPLQNSIQNYPLPKNVKNEINHDVTTKFKPLENGTVFKGKLRFHNLNKIEIGALLSAITFHGQNQNHMHNIGMAKSLGYGKIDIQLMDFKYFDNLTKENMPMYLKAFEDEITNQIPNWKNSPQCKELFAMANTTCKAKEDLQYQLLENPKPKYGKEKNDFTGAKKEREYLILHSSNMPKPISQEYENRSKKTEIQKIAPAVEKKANIEVGQTTVLEQIYQVYDGNILQVYNAFKNKHLVKFKFDERALAQKLHLDMQQDENLSKSNKPKDIERFEFLKQYL